MSETDVARAMASARRRLAAAGVPDPARDASALFVGLIEDWIGAAGIMPEDVAQIYEDAVQRRIRRQPVSQITGRRAFWMHDFIVTPAVLDPRPETETLVRAATDLPADALADPARWPRLPEADWPPVPFERVLDLGTGSGCILASLLHEQPDATGLGVDISAEALDVAARNAEVAGVADRAAFARSDWLDGVDGTFDLIVSNPPYIAEAEMAALSPEVLHEPRIALTPGGDGLEAYRIIARDAPAHLEPAGRLMVEIGPTQAAAVRDLFLAAGLVHIAVLPDLDGRDRIVTGEKPPA
ncbi:peptide chain release factor N(5)-glutamine methyltransferase [Jannaschia aquimarina]|uniref:Release factor glutamine methyltransferase n=1 Tax=Jannaschia aquimarina TaxID=935700 RepID=A0A0D1EQG6_9RHOB|nr:peptide chain release factor N(5)-glutamine methyltransferase [Jannaschia aquimarina]KIT17835.1 Release factor glutamine methyltransferase [Jannaschia aquimarina]SNS90402.1 [protein release factor]-glutamine N5-methyltransferase [Jannaschia aquimarina]